MSNHELVAYVPVIHQGYVELFRKFGGEVDGLWVLGFDLVSKLSTLREIRAVDPKLIAVMATSLGFFSRAEVLEEGMLLRLKDKHILMPDEAISRRMAKEYFTNQPVKFEPVFLRWDEGNVTSAQEVKADRESHDPFDQEMMHKAEIEANRGSDWWRHVGAVIVKQGSILLAAHNQHEPSEQTPYFVGDPRDAIESGTNNLLYSSIHAEQFLVSFAAGEGIKLRGTSLYINIFPCPMCTKLIAHAGIKKCFFKTGSTWLNSEEVMRSYGIEIVRIKD